MRVQVCVFVYLYMHAWGWRRPIGCLIFIGHFPQKSPVIRGFFAKNDLQLKASYGSLQPCTKHIDPCVCVCVCVLVYACVVCVYLCIHKYTLRSRCVIPILWGGYVSKLFTIIGHFCKRALLNRWYSAKETCSFKEPINHSHPIGRKMNDSWHTCGRIMAHT